MRAQTQSPAGQSGLTFMPSVARLTLQHQLIEYRNGSLYVGPVDQVLYDSKRRGAHYPAILDVGCGPGTSASVLLQGTQPLTLQF